MRAAALAMMMALTACAQADFDEGDPSLDEPSEDGSAERLDVPEQYRLHWNTTEPCHDEDGEQGVQLYRHAGDARSEGYGATATLYATETWYWFHGQDPALDCKDVFTLTGEYLVGPYEALGCVECEEGYAYTRVMVEQGCPYDYDFAFGQPRDVQADDALSFEGFLLFDTHTSTGAEPNEGGRMGIFARHLLGDRWFVDPAYADRGMTRRVAESDRSGPPADYVWVGESCVIQSL